MNPTQNHHKTTLTACACGQVHFTYGPITVRFDPDQFLAFAASVAMLSSQFRQSVGSLHPVETSSTHGDLCH